MWCFLPRTSPEETLLLSQQKWSVSRLLKGKASLPLELSSRVGVETAKRVWSSPAAPGEEGSRGSGDQELNQESHMPDDRRLQPRPRPDPAQMTHDTLSSHTQGNDGISYNLGKSEFSWNPGTIHCIGWNSDYKVNTGNCPEMTLANKYIATGNSAFSHKANISRSWVVLASVAPPSGSHRH